MAVILYLLLLERKRRRRLEQHVAALSPASSVARCKSKHFSASIHPGPGEVGELHADLGTELPTER